MKMNEQPDLDPQSMVERFHRLFDILVQQTPGQVDERTRVLRERLIQEEDLMVVGAEYSLETGVVDFFDGPAVSRDPQLF